MKTILSCDPACKKLYVHFPYSPTLVELARAIPGPRKWDPEAKAWVTRPTVAVLEYLVKKFPNVTYDDKVASRLQEIKSKRESFAKKEVPVVNDYKFETQPYEHQLKAFALSREKEAFALLMDMGTGKSKVIIDTAAYNYIKDRIDSVLVLAPNSVKTNWITDELPVHMPEYIEYDAAYWMATPNKANRQDMARLMEPNGKLKFFAMNIEALSSKRGFDFAKSFVSLRSCLVVIDESTRIKTPGATRTKNAVKLGTYAAMRRILTGTPITQGPLDLFSQFLFLDEDILGHSSFYTFRNRYAIMGGYENKEVLGYQNLDELQEIVDQCSYRVLKSDCLDLPDKVYQTRYVQLSKEQRTAYKGLDEDLRTSLKDGELTAANVLTKLLRLQQVIGGFVPTDDDSRAMPLPGANPRLDELATVIEEHGQGKVIIWARFRAEILAIAAMLSKLYGRESVVTFYGDVSEDDRIYARKSFQDQGSPVRFFVAQQETGGIGLTLTAATTVVYYSNTFSLEHRLQSEDRAHRVGQRNTVTYIDLVAEDVNLDKKVLEALRYKKDLASLVNRDNVTDYL